MTVCKKCGKCCKLLIFKLGLGLPAELIEFYEAHGCKIENGHIFVPKKCQHLMDNNACAIHDHKPKICRDFEGQDNGTYYIHEGCAFSKEG